MFFICYAQFKCPVKLYMFIFCVFSIFSMHIYAQCFCTLVVSSGTTMVHLLLAGIGITMVHTFQMTCAQHFLL